MSKFLKGCLFWFTYSLFMLWFTPMSIGYALCRGNTEQMKFNDRVIDWINTLEDKMLSLTDKIRADTVIKESQRSMNNAQSD